MQLQNARRLTPKKSSDGRTGVLEHRNDAVGSKMAREMLCFTIETAAVGGEGRSCETAVAGYVRAMFALCPRHSRSSPHWNGGLETA